MSSANWSNSKWLDSLKWKPCNSFKPTAFYAKLAKPSASIRNNKGDKGSPLSQPSNSLKLILRISIYQKWTDMELLNTKASIHWSYFEPKPIFFNVNLRYSQLTLSWAFWKSTVKSKHSILCLEAKSATSFRIKIPS